MRTDGRDEAEVIVPFRKSANAPKTVNTALFLVIFTAPCFDSKG